MLKIGLLATTALIVAGSISFVAAKSAKISNDRGGDIAIAAVAGEDGPAHASDRPAVFSNPGRDRNRDFLCTYGYDVSHYRHKYSGYYAIHWQHYAVPIKGKGASVSEIAVTDSPSVGSSKFKVGIYSNADGKPGTLIAGGAGKAHGSCLLTTVLIPKTFLAAGEKYWVEEDMGNHPGLNVVSWGYNPNAKHNAYYQYYSYVSSSGAVSSHLSDWLPVSGPAPFVKVR